MVVVSTPSVHVLVGVKPVTLPKFDPVSVESSGGSRLSACHLLLPAEAGTDESRHRVLGKQQPCQAQLQPLEFAMSVGTKG